mmetsp:Transcript_42243/g.99187  ORF Transcript_42243/g.99187 Transcript_42243/m.99187 type:complete len:877 (+) Transcript_42243:56-2686(+)
MGWGSLLLGIGTAALAVAEGFFRSVVTWKLCLRCAVGVIIAWKRTPSWALFLAAVVATSTSGGLEDVSPSHGHTASVIFTVFASWMTFLYFVRFVGRMWTCAIFMAVVSLVAHQLAVFRFLFMPDNLWAELANEEVRPSAGAPVSYPAEPLTWSEAEVRARTTLAEMTDLDRYSLMSGQGWDKAPELLAAMLPIPGIPKYAYYAGNTKPIPRLGVPSLKMHDAGQGYRNMPWPVGKEGTSVVWPCSLAWGATWDQQLVEAAAGALAREYRNKGANMILGPAVQVHRVARNGRNFEYMSGEDPYLGSRLSYAYVRAVQREGVIACLKHWAFNEQETERNEVNSLVDERTAWELYYPPFEAGIAAGAGSVMCSYNRVNGTHACSNPELLSRDLKLRMGFKGFVVSDWWAVRESAELAVPGGLDMEMPGNAKAYMNRKDMERFEGSLEEKRLENEYLRLGASDVHTDAAHRILAAAHKMHLTGRPSCIPSTMDCQSLIESVQRPDDSLHLAYRIASESIILLKNDRALPLKRRQDVQTVAFVGAALSARSRRQLQGGGGIMEGDFYSGGGSGHSHVRQEDLVTPLAALQRRAESANFSVSVSDSNDLAQARIAARKADIVVALVHTTSGEAEDRPDLHLDDGGDALVEAMAAMRPTIALVVAPGAVLLPWKDSVAAIAMMFLGGEKTGEALASVVFGDVAPSGKLPLMIPADASSTIEPTERVTNYHREGLFTSYRSATNVAAFPFGHGLSYAEFAYSEASEVEAANCLDASLLCVQLQVRRTELTMSGQPLPTLGCAEVVQAYIEFPPEAHEPKLVLRGFHKTRFLKATEEETVFFGFTARDLSIYRFGDWELQRSVTVHIGASSADIRASLALPVPQ